MEEEISNKNKSKMKESQESKLLSKETFRNEEAQTLSSDDNNLSEFENGIKEITKDALEFEDGSVCSFSSLNGSISESTMKAIKDMNFETMTEIQAKSIPKLLEGHDLRGTAKTGSGKTLAFLIPVVEFIVKSGFEPSLGTGAIILSPTRELSMQIFGVLRDLMKYHSQTYGLIIGGANRNVEAKKLGEGMNIIVATPGRLLDHLNNTENFSWRNLRRLVLDEADRILDVGFERELKKIINLLPKNRQTMLFSATKKGNGKLDEIEKLALRPKFIEVDIVCDKKLATTDGLTQMYAICPMEKKFLALYTFLEKNKEKKIMVFFGTCMAVKYYNELLNFLHIPVKCINGRLRQSKRTSAFQEFLKAENGILLCTDVAGRGLDIPNVDWIIQYDAPDDPKDYIHRVGRTARAGNKGNALLYLSENEKDFVLYLKENKVNVDEMKINWSGIENIQTQLEEVVTNNINLTNCARKAFKAYFRSYRSRNPRGIFDVSKLDAKKVGMCFGLTEVSNKMVGKKNKNKNKKRRNFGSTNEEQFRSNKRFKY